MLDPVDRLRLRLTSQGYPPATIYRYTQIADQFFRFSGGQLTRSNVEAFLALKGKSGTYKRWLMYVLKALFTATETAWPLTRREVPRLSQASRPFLTVQMMQDLLKLSEENLLDHALLRIAVSTGMRRKELTRIRLGDYNPPVLLCRLAKGEDIKPRTLPLKTCAAVDKYLVSRPLNLLIPLNPLFLTPRGQAITTEYLNAMAKKYQKALGWPSGMALHAVRRGFVTMMYENGFRERELQELMGWKTPTMPAVYIRLVPGQLDEKAKKVVEGF